MNRLLLIEDEDVIRKQLTLLLERNSYEVVAAASLDEALKLYPESFDVILADIRLPGRDGNQILNYCEQVPVIMMTSYASVRSAVESMAEWHRSQRSSFAMPAQGSTGHQTCFQ